MKFVPFVARYGTLSLMLATSSFASAQTPIPTIPYNLGDAVRAAEAAQADPLPSTAGEPTLPLPIEPQLTLDDNETLLVRSFVVEGPSFGAETRVHEILAPYENRELTITEIYAAADKLTNLYRSMGYLLAKAYIPAQDARSGVVRIDLIPGRYGTIAIQNHSLVRDDYLRGMIDQALEASPIIHKDALERAMLLVGELPGAALPRVAIGAGRQPRTSDLVFDIPERPRFDGWLLGDNFGSPYTGRDRLSGALSVNSPLGYGDRLYGFGIVSEQTNLVNGRIAYSFPLGYDGLRGEIGAYRTTYVLSGVYKALEATGTANAITAALTYPLKRLRDDSIDITGSYAHRSLNDKARGISFADRTLDLVTVALTRNSVGAFEGVPFTTSAAFSFTVGQVNFPEPRQRQANLATIDTVGAYARVDLVLNTTVALGENLSLSALFRAQKSLSGNLDSSELMSLTGFYGVRSYDEGLSGDSGYLVTPELRFGLPDIFKYRHSLGVFTDVGAVWLENGSYTTIQKNYTQVNDVGLAYYGTYEYSPARVLLLKAQVAHTYGSDSGAQIYNQGTKGLVQVGFTF